MVTSGHPVVGHSPTIAMISLGTRLMAVLIVQPSLFLPLIPIFQLLKTLELISLQTIYKTLLNLILPCIHHVQPCIHHVQPCTAIQGIDSGPERTRNIDRKSMLPSYASHFHPKPRVDRFHTIDFTVPEANLYAHG